MRFRLRPSAILLLVLLIFGIAVYGYFTTPLPFGLSSIIRTPGGAAAQPGGTFATPQPSAVAIRSAGGGQVLSLGAVSVAVQGIQRNVDLSANGRTGPAGAFTIVLVSLQNTGSQPVSLQTTNFTLADDRGRSYAVDVEATRAAATASRRRYPFEATLPPSGTLDTALAFEPAADANTLTLRVSLGYGEVELPR